MAVCLGFGRAWLLKRVVENRLASDGGVKREMVIKTKLLPPGACAFTVWPFVFVHPLFAKNPSVAIHESVHLEQQRAWVIYGLGVGLLVWFALYLFVLPVGWNFFRRKWETEAMLAEGRDPGEIRDTLRRAPYYLWR